MTTALKPLFLDLLKVGLYEFSMNHPGHRCAMRILEAGYKVTEEQLQQAWIEEQELASKEYDPKTKTARAPYFAKIAEDFISYQFTQGNSSYFKKLSWL